MKTHLQFTFFFLLSLMLAQAQDPVIDGDTLICPYTDGTVALVGTDTYDTYQWYYKYWFTSDPFEAIPGANSESFTFDWYTYDQALFKLEVTLGGNTFESNTLQIDSYAWAGLFVINEPSEDVVIDPNNGNWLICDGDYIVNTVGMPYSICQWYKDGNAIDGATGTEYTITSPGVYHVVAAPAFCPDVTSNSIPLVVEENPDCDIMGLDDNPFSLVQVYPNPVETTLNVQNFEPLDIEKFAVINLLGQEIITEEVNNFQGQIHVSDLNDGVYFLRLDAKGSSKSFRFVKK